VNQIHASAIIHPKAQIADNVEIGPYTVIGEHVRLHPGTQIAAHVVIDGWTEIGEGCRVFPFASIGSVPQDLKFKGEESQVRIGRHNTIREYVTVNRGTEQGGGVTKIGDHNLLMAYVHVAHDCQIGDHVILANAATLAGHITVQDYAVIGGLTGLHQFVRIGRHSIIGGCSAVAQDIPPFVSAVGNRVKLYGLNAVGLKRHGFSDEQLASLKSAYKILFRSKLSMKEAVKKIRDEWPHSAEAQELATFVETSERGVCR
jgi:UDP-N-acetylglucosamine acyltransferase